MLNLKMRLRWGMLESMLYAPNKYARIKFVLCSYYAQSYALFSKLCSFYTDFTRALCSFILIRALCSIKNKIIDLIMLEILGLC